MVKINVYAQEQMDSKALKTYKCPACNYLYKFYYTTPMNCKGCARTMIDVMALVNLPSNRLRWHFGEPK